MAARGAKQSTSHRVSKDSVAKQFVRLYYNILNTSHEYLYQFYGAESTIVVSELVGGKTMTETADTEEAVQDLLKSLYAEVDVKVESSVPQFTVDDSVLLLISGTMSRKSYDEERVFTQVLLLAPQENGFYIRTDTVHVLGKSRSSPMIHCFDSHGNEKIMSGEGADGQMSPTTPRTADSDSSGSMMIGQFSNTHRFATPVSANVRNDIQTCTPPAHEADPHLVDGAKSSDSEDEHNNQSNYLMGGLPPTHGPRPAMPRRSTHPSMGGGLPLHPMPPMTMPFRGPVPVGRGHYREMSMSMNMNMNMAPAPVRAERRRSLSMGSDPRILSAPPGHGVFIARLPFGIQAEDVAEAFAPFGPILGGAEGIQVRDGRNGCYSFVIFESAASATSAIQKGAVVQGKRVYVEPRYPRQDAGGEAQRSTPVSGPASPPSAATSPAARSGIPAAPRRSA